MEDAEFELLDELYFVIPYQQLKNIIEWNDDEIKNILMSLAAKEWIRVYKNSEEELDEFDINHNFKSYFYLASKKGLLAHNRQ